MDEKDFFKSRSSTISLYDAVAVIILVIKILVGFCLLYIGIYLTFWSVRIIEQFVNTPEQVPLLNFIITSDSTQDLFKITRQENSFIIGNGLMLKWVILFLVILILFNVIGRAISAVYAGAFKMFAHLNVKDIVTGKKESSDGDTRPEE
jgi:uncharacterized membrane protein (DUF373 family)